MPILVNNGFITVLNIPPITCAFTFSKKRKDQVCPRRILLRLIGFSPEHSSSFWKYIPQAAHTKVSWSTYLPDSLQNLVLSLKMRQSELILPKFMINRPASVNGACTLFWVRTFIKLILKNQHCNIWHETFVYIQNFNIQLHIYFCFHFRF